MTDLRPIQMNEARYLTKETIEESASFVRGRSAHRPTVALITGSGLAGLADEVENADVIPFDEIPHFPSSGVEGHPGELVLGPLVDTTAVIMRGRVHFYEGYPMQQITFPVRVMQALGAETLIVTNAAGGLNRDFRAGDLMLITDHINLIGMAGFNPLRGPNDPRLGPRFPNMAQAYDPELQALARRVAGERGTPLQEGVYIMLAGPTFETPADVHMLRTMGADAVGMSTVPEVTVARHGGMRALGFSLISNVINGEPAAETPPEELHGEVLEAGEAATPRLIGLIKGVVREL